MISFMKKFTVIYLIACCFLTMAMQYDPNDPTVKKVTAYVMKYINPHMSVIEGRTQLSYEQQQELYRWVKGKKFKDISGEQIYTDRRARFNKGRVKEQGSREYLVRKWCEEYGINRDAWPKEGATEYHAHHIIPLQFGGLNKWWNIVPLRGQVHREIHSEVDGELIGGGRVSVESLLVDAFRDLVVNN